MKVEYTSPDCALIRLAPMQQISLLAEFDDLLNNGNGQFGGPGESTIVSDGDISVDIG